MGLPNWESNDILLIINRVTLCRLKSQKKFALNFDYYYLLYLYLSSLNEAL